MLKTSIRDYEKLSVVTSFYFINWQSIHKTNYMQRIERILMWEVLPAIALNKTVFLIPNQNKYKNIFTSLLSFFFFISINVI